MHTSTASGVQHMVQGETVATLGQETVEKPHHHGVKPIEDCSNELQLDGKPENKCA